jgi:hypothetical protein
VPHCTPAPSHDVGWQSVVVEAGSVDVVTIVDVLAGLVLVGDVLGVGVTTGVDPHSGSVGSTADLHVVVVALCFVTHAERQSLPALRFGHAALQVVKSLPMAFLHGLGHRPAIAVGLDSSTMTIATTRRTGTPLDSRADRIGRRRLSTSIRPAESSPYASALSNVLGRFRWMAVSTAASASAGFARFDSFPRSFARRRCGSRDERQRERNGYRRCRSGRTPKPVAASLPRNARVASPLESRRRAMTRAACRARVGRGECSTAA